MHELWLLGRLLNGLKNTRPRRSGRLNSCAIIAAMLSWTAQSELLGLFSGYSLFSLEIGLRGKGCIWRDLPVLGLKTALKRV